MRSIRNIIPQNNRTILFQDVSEESENILSLLGDIGEQESVSDEVIRGVEQHLLVQSAEEYTKKFPAVIYYAIENGKIIISGKSGVCSTEREQRTLWNENCNAKCYADCNAKCYADCYELWEKLFAQQHDRVGKRKNAAYRLFDDRTGMETIKALRKRLWIEFLLPEDKNPAMREVRLQEILKQIRFVRYEIRAILPLIVEDLKTEEKEDKKQKASAAGGQPVLSAILEAGNDRIELWYQNSGDVEWSRHVTEENQKRIHEWLSSKLVVTGEEMNEFVTIESNVWKDVLLTLFCPQNVRSEQKSAPYFRMYEQAVYDFYQIAKRKAETALGVQAYFKQGRGTAEPMTLLIANITPEELVTPVNRKKIEVFLKTVNTKNDYSSSIWMGILPGVHLQAEGGRRIRKRFSGRERIASDTVKPETVKSLLELTGVYQIMLFYQYETREEASAYSFAESGIHRFIESGKIYETSSYSRYLSCCYPNLTVLEEEVYIGAAFAAAGFMASLQSSRFLRLFYKEVESDCPGVRFDTEANRVFETVTPVLPKELYPYSSQTRSEMQKMRYGCLFASQTGEPDGKSLSMMMLFCARTLHRTGNSYEQIYRVLTEVYLHRMFGAVTADFKEDEVRYHFSKAKDSWLNEIMGTKDCVNALWKNGDNITYRTDDKKNGSITIEWDTGGK